MFAPFIGFPLERGLRQACKGDRWVKANLKSPINARVRSRTGVNSFVLLIAV